MNTSNDTVDASNAEIGMDDCNKEDAKPKHAGQLVHRFVHNFHVHEGEQTWCASCGDEKVCLRCSHVGKKECETCGIWVSRASFANHRRIHTGERPYKCAHCLEAFSRKDNLVRHLRRHTGEKPFLCEKCGMQFRNLSNLRDHQASIHSTAGKHECEQCGRAFKQRQSLMRHMRRVHDKVCTCRECNEILPTRDAFTEHCWIHSGENKHTESSEETEDVEDIVQETGGETEEDKVVKSETMLE